jgi:hypothetical protein
MSMRGRSGRGRGVGRCLIMDVVGMKRFGMRNVTLLNVDDMTLVYFYKFLLKLQTTMHYPTRNTISCEDEKSLFTTFVLPSPNQPKVPRKPHHYDLAQADPQLLQK